MRRPIASERSSRAVKRLLLLPILATALACGAKREDLGNSRATADVKPSEYDKALERWSTEDKVYQALETRIIVDATWKSGAFREAYVGEYARRYLLSEGERDSMLKKELDAASTYQEFFFAAYTDESRTNDFNKRNTIWRVRLFDDKGGFTDPLVISKQKDDDPVLHAFFPYFSIWKHGYDVKFAKNALSPDTKTLRLQLTSAIADALLTFDANGADVPSPVRVDAGGAVSAASPIPVATPAAQ